MFGNTFDHSYSNTFGGENYYDDHNQILGHSETDALGHESFFDNHNSKLGYKKKNIFGGYDFFDENNQKIYYTQENIDGSFNYFDNTNSHVGHMEFTDFGGSFTDSYGNHTSWHDNILGGINMDPLHNVNSLTFPSFL